MSVPCGCHCGVQCGGVPVAGPAENDRSRPEHGVDLNAPSSDLYSLATPLHHAVCSGSLDAVKALVEAGADLHIKDKAERATPLGWADYYRREAERDEDKQRYGEIAAYLRERGG